MAEKACTATISFLSEDADFGQRQQIPETKIDHVWHGAHVEARVEQWILTNTIHLPKIHPIGISQQFESQRDNPRKVLYVQETLVYNCDTSVGYLHTLVPNSLPQDSGYKERSV